MTLGGGEIAAAVDKLDGIAGWLTLFGYNLAVRRIGYKEALDETVSEGAKIVRGELEHFLEGRERRTYLAVLRAIALRGHEGARWNEIMRLAGAELGRALNPSVLANALDGLLRAGMVVEEDGVYRIVDPMLEEAVPGIRV